MSQIGQKTWPPRTNESSQWAGLRNDWPYLPHRLSYQNQTSWAYVQNEPGKLPTKAFWAQPIGGAINAKNLYLKDHWTEFHQIWYEYSRGDYWLIPWVPWWNVKVGVACASLTVSEDSLVRGGHVFWPIWLIYNRNVYFHPLRLCPNFGVDRVNISKLLFILLFFTLCKLAKNLIRRTFMVWLAFL